MDAYVQKVKIDGVIGNIEFNDKGDVTTNIHLFQYQKIYKDGVKSYVAVQVGTWIASNGQLLFEIDKFDWSSFRRNATAFNHRSLQSSL